MSEEDFENSLTITAPAVARAPQTHTIGIDHVNNLEQKEKAMSDAGLTRYRAMMEIFFALEATKTIEVREEDEDGIKSWVSKVVPDYRRREWAVEMIVKLFGDSVTQIQGEMKVTHSVEELLRIVDQARRRKTIDASIN